MFYSMSWEAVVVRDLWEDPTLPVKMKLSPDGVLYVRGQFIEETRSYSSPVKMALTADGKLYSRFFIELGQPATPFDYTSCSMVLTASFTGSYAGDTFDCYVNGSIVNDLAGGNGFTGNWVDIPLYVAISGMDTFESYSSGSAVNGLSDGTDWGGNWVDKILG